MKIIKRLAFTLSETLLVMGIIGVIAAITVPNLNKTTGNAETVAKLKKTYMTLNEAYERAQVKYGPLNRWLPGLYNVKSDETASTGLSTNSAVARVGKRMAEFLKVTKSEANTDGSEWILVLADGTYITISLHQSKFSFYDGVTFNVYLNGSPVGAQDGVDHFQFQMRKVDSLGGFTLRGYYQNHYNTTLGTATFSQLLTLLSGDSYNDSAGAEWILRYGNTDYMLIQSNGKCKNDTVPTEANPRCK